MKSLKEINWWKVSGFPPTFSSVNLAVIKIPCD